MTSASSAAAGEELLIYQHRPCKTQIFVLYGLKKDVFLSLDFVE